MLIAQVIVNNSEEVSLAVQGAWQDTWELAFNGTLYKALTNLGLIIAVASLLLWTIQFTLDAKFGLSELDVVRIVINSRKLTPLANAITIRGTDGEPLIASRMNC